MSYNSHSNLWVLKYKPNKLEELAGRKDFIRRFKEICKKENVSHMLFSGPVGYGKMTAAILTAKEILGNSFASNFKVVYAADPLTDEERADVQKRSYVSTRKVGSIAGRKFTWPAFIFSRVKPFVELKPIGDKSFKILVVRDFHKLGANQQGFRRLMEKYSQSCRMILLTNEISSIIDPILSRCMTFFFSKIDLDSFSAVINRIAGNEGLKFIGNICKMLYISTEGRIGDSINILQKIAVKDKKIEPNSVYRAISSDYKLELSVLARNIFQDVKIMEKDGKKIDKMETIKRSIRKLDKMGYDFKEILTGLCEGIFNLPIHETLKAGILNILGDADFGAINTNDDLLQLDNVLYQLELFSKKANKLGV
ncbi:MAG: hypothetical protein ACTSWY_03135 [Promethearchaeota archaeon]